MKYFLFIILFIPIFSIGQKIDTVIDAKIFKSYYSYSIKDPVYVIYKLYKGGGPCSRKGMTFKSGGIKNSPVADDYYKSGYDQGHIANFEDFASDCVKGEATFRFYNVLPQISNLNRGPWKMYEAMIREISQNDSLLIIAGGSKYTKKIGSGVGVPEYCWKLVYSLSKKVVVYALWFKNDTTALYSVETVTTLEQKLGYPIRQYLK